MITEDYCSYEVARLLKEKGFDEPCIAVYEEGVLRINTLCYYHNSELSSYICAPTLQMTMKWLREVYNIFIYIEPFITTSGLQGYKPYCTKIGGEFMWINPLRKYSNTLSDTYEQAVEAAIKYCLENLI